MSATTIHDDRTALLEAIAHDSFRLGQFKLSAGGTSDYYIDCRLTTLAARGGLLTGRVLYADLRALDPAPEAVGGLTLGADPIVTAVAVQSALAGQPMDGFLVRKSEKTHGTARRIEGPVRKGARVAIVDDVCTTAASTVQAIEAAWEAELEVVAVRCLVEREEGGGRENLNRLWRTRYASDCPFQTLFTVAQVREAHGRAKPARGSEAAQ